MSFLVLILVALVPLLWWMSTATALPPGARSAARRVLLAVLGLCVVGFGLCGAAGAFFGVATLFQDSPESKFALAILVPSAIGLVVAFGAYKLVTRVRRQSPRPRPGEGSEP